MIHLFLDQGSLLARYLDSIHSKVLDSDYECVALGPIRLLDSRFSKHAYPRYTWTYSRGELTRSNDHKQNLCHL